MQKITLALVRHGQSQWNQKNLFTGWTDIDLSDKGVQEARKAGQLLKKKEIIFDKAFSSVLKRAIRTLWLILDEMDLMWVPVTKSWRLNERHYGDLQGKNKAQTRELYGEKQVKIWRRDFFTKPPDIKTQPALSAAYKEVKTLPKGESLKDTSERLIPFWKQEIRPEIKQGKSLLIAAHGNSLRALIKHLENIPDDKIHELNIPTGKPIIYTLNTKGDLLSKESF